MLESRQDAYELLQRLGASERLIQHAHAVADAASEVLEEFRTLGVSCNYLQVEMAAVLHDIGKIQHPEELSETGSIHEQAGERLLLANGVQPDVARCCVSQAAWNVAGTSLEERTVALADKLWKGRREAELELLIVDEVALRLNVSRWDVFVRLDAKFEEVAAGGSERLLASRDGSVVS